MAHVPTCIAELSTANLLHAIARRNARRDLYMKYTRYGAWDEAADEQVLGYLADELADRIDSPRTRS